MKAFVNKLFAEPRVTHIQTDPDPRNARAIRCYVKAGFQPIREANLLVRRVLVVVGQRHQA